MQYGAEASFDIQEYSCETLIKNIIYTAASFCLDPSGRNQFIFSKMMNMTKYNQKCKLMMMIENAQ